MALRLEEGSSIRSDDRHVHGRFAGAARPSGSMAFGQEPAGFRLQNCNEISADLIAGKSHGLGLVTGHQLRRICSNFGESRTRGGRAQWAFFQRPQKRQIVDGLPSVLMNPDPRGVNSPKNNDAEIILPVELQSVSPSENSPQLL